MIKYLLKCTSSYPAPIEEANLVMISDLAQRYKVTTGLSDHTLVQQPRLQGAQIIEKHFILDKSVGGPDSSFLMRKVYSNGKSCKGSRISY